MFGSRETARGSAVVMTMGLALAGAVAATPAAAAAESGDTITTFSLTTGSLAISAPGTAHLGTAATGGNAITGQLGNVTVTDNRGALLSSWTASVTSTDFETGSGGAGETVPASALAYVAGAPSATGQFTGGTGLGVFAPLPTLALSTGPQPIGTQAAIGSNTARWNPTITVTVPQGAVAGTYTGTITHSVA